MSASAPLPPTSALLRAYHTYLRLLAEPIEAGESVLEHWGKAHVAACRALEGDGAEQTLVNDP